jgi:hypothetical protein
MIAKFLQRFITEFLPIVYQEKIADLRNLQNRITEATVKMTEVMFVNTWCEIDYRFDVRRATNGVHTETYWAPKKLCATEA